MTSHIDPTRERFAEFRDLSRGHAIHMLNLVRPRAGRTQDSRLPVRRGAD